MTAFGCLVYRWVNQQVFHCFQIRSCVYTCTCRAFRTRASRAHGHGGAGGGAGHARRRRIKANGSIYWTYELRVVPTAHVPNARSAVTCVVRLRHEKNRLRAHRVRMSTELQPNGITRHLHSAMTKERAHIDVRHIPDSTRSRRLRAHVLPVHR